MRVRLSAGLVANNTTQRAPHPSNETEAEDGNFRARCQICGTRFIQIEINLASPGKRQRKRHTAGREDTRREREKMTKSSARLLKDALS